MNWAAIAWFALLLVFLIVEAACPIHLVSIWFAAGSLVAMLVAFWGGKLWLQIALFLVVSCVLVALLWPFIKKFLNPKLKKIFDVTTTVIVVLFVLAAVVLVIVKKKKTGNATGAEKN